MVAPITFAARAGLRVFKDASGRFRSATGKFISSQVYERERRRLPSGKFISRAAFLGRQQNRNLEDYYESLLGPPRGEGTWTARFNASSHLERQLLGQA